MLKNLNRKHRKVTRGAGCKVPPLFSGRGAETQGGKRRGRKGTLASASARPVVAVQGGTRGIHGGGRRIGPGPCLRGGTPRPRGEAGSRGHDRAPVPSAPGSPGPPGAPGAG